MNRLGYSGQLVAQAINFRSSMNKTSSRALTLTLTLTPTRTRTRARARARARTRTRKGSQGGTDRSTQ